MKKAKQILVTMSLAALLFWSGPHLFGYESVPFLKGKVHFLNKGNISLTQKLTQPAKNSKNQGKATHILQAIYFKAGITSVWEGTESHQNLLLCQQKTAE